MPLQYVVGDATAPQGEGRKLIAHIVNPVGAFGAGFVVAVNRRWPAVRPAYQKLCAQAEAEGGQLRLLGKIQVMDVEEGIAIANLFAQLAPGASRPIRYDALYNALEALQKLLAVQDAPVSVHMPRIGAGLARGHWPIIEQIVIHTLVSPGVDVTVYDLPVQA